MIRLTLLLTWLAFLILAEGSVAAKNAYAKIALGPQSKQGALVFRAMTQVHNWTLVLTPIDEQGRTRGFGKSVNMGGSRIVPTTERHTLQIWPMKPGRYVVRFLKTQDYWAGCLAASTWAIDIAPGTVTDIGLVDPAPTVEAIEREVLRAGKMISRGGIHMLHENIPPPAVAGADDDQAAATKEEIGARAPGLTAPIIAARPEPASFPRKPGNNPIAACG